MSLLTLFASACVARWKMEGWQKRNRRERVRNVENLRRRGKVRMDNDCKKKLNNGGRMEKRVGVATK